MTLRSRGRSAVVALALVAGALLVAATATDLVQLPNLDELARRVTSTLGPYTYVVVGAMAFLETAAATGLIAPGEAVVILGGVAAAHGEVELLPLVGLVWACAVAGDVVGFLAGRSLGRQFLVAHGHRVKLTPERLARVERYLRRHGGKTIIAGQFIGIVRTLAPAVAGAGRMPVRRFLPASIVGTGLWASACIVVGYLCWTSIDEVLGIVKDGSLVLGAAAGVLVVGVAVVRRRRAGRGGAKRAGRG